MSPYNRADRYNHIYPTSSSEQLYLYNLYSSIITSTAFDVSLIEDEKADDIDILLNALICEDVIEDRT